MTFVYGRSDDGKTYAWNDRYVVSLDTEEVREWNECRELFSDVLTFERWLIRNCSKRSVLNFYFLEGYREVLKTLTDRQFDRVTK